MDSLPCKHSTHFTRADFDTSGTDGKEVIIGFVLCNDCKRAIPQDPQLLQKISGTKVAEIATYLREKRGYIIQYRVHPI